jgi:hypothetical protein
MRRFNGAGNCRSAAARRGVTNALMANRRRKRCASKMYRLEEAIMNFRCSLTLRLRGVTWDAGGLMQGLEQACAGLKKTIRPPQIDL